MSDFTPVISLPVKNISGLNLEFASLTSIKVYPGECWDSANVHSLVLPEMVTIDATRNGANGLDTGSLAAAKTYYIYVIGDSSKHNLPKTIMSLSASPYLPYGYDIVRRIGWWRTDGSSEFWSILQSGNGNLRHYFIDAPLNVLTDGASITYANVDLSPIVPPVDNVVVGLKASFTPATAATNLGYMRTFGSSADSLWQVNAEVDAVKQITHLPVLAKLDSGVPKIQYKVTNASDKLTLDVMYFIDNL
jgi:hypothetical protein